MRDAGAGLGPALEAAGAIGRQAPYAPLARPIVVGECLVENQRAVLPGPVHVDDEAALQPAEAILEDAPGRRPSLEILRRIA